MVSVNRRWLLPIGLTTALVLCAVERCDASSTIKRVRWLFGTVCSMQVTAEADAAERATESAFTAMRAVETRFSNYQPDSEIAALNRRGAGTWPASGELLMLLRTGVRLRDTSDGRFDLGVWPLMQLWQRCSDEQRLPTDAEIAQARRAGDTHPLQLDDAHGTVRVASPGCALDLSALVKGYAIDQAVATLRAASVEDATINAGGQLYVLRDDSDPSVVDVVDPRDEHRVVARLRIANRSVATSSQSEQSWTIRGRRYGHLLHPQTGWPEARACLSATVIAPTGLEADGAATVAALLGPEAGQRFIATRHGAEAMWLLPGAKPATLRFITTPGWSRLTHMTWFGDHE